MKKFLLAGLMLASMNVFSQSYLVLSNGVTLTTDAAGFVYDFGHFHLPYKTTIVGGQFLVDGHKLYTVDSAGFMYEKDTRFDRVRGLGLNYFIDVRNTLFTVDKNGFVYSYNDSLFRRAHKFGGNFFLANTADNRFTNVYTVNSTGNYTMAITPNLNPSLIVTFGGNFFHTKAGVVYTVSKDGFVFPKTDIKVPVIKKWGGNYFIEGKGKLYTVTEEGILLEAILPPNLKVTNILSTGANYIVDKQGRYYAVDKAGAITELAVKHDLRKIKVGSF